MTQYILLYPMTQIIFSYLLFLYFINHILLTEKVDVYSFGIMVWQMATDNVPFKGMTRDDFIARVAKRDERPAMER